MEVTGGTFSRFEKYFRHSCRGSFEDLMFLPLSFFTLSIGQGTNLPVISFIIFEVFLEAPCL